MTKIRNPGPGGSVPAGGPDSTENIKDTSSAKEAAQTAKTSAESTSAPLRQTAADKFAAGDLKTAGDQLKSQLHSQLQNASDGTKKAVDSSLSPEQLAAEAAKGQVRFAPPYVPVGPVVMGDNIALPGQDLTGSGETTQMSLKADQFQINDQGMLVITNEKLIEYFKSLKETGQDVLLGITNRKLPGEE